MEGFGETIIKKYDFNGDPLRFNSVSTLLSPCIKGGLSREIAERVNLEDNF